MIYLILTIVFTSLLFIIFKMFEQFRINMFQAIVANYVTCVLTGLAFSPESIEGIANFDLEWFPFSMLMGAMFMGIFYIIGQTAQKVGVSAASISSKISMIIPILFSLLLLQNAHKDYNWINYGGLALSLFAVYYASKKEVPEGHEMKKGLFFLPLAVFLTTGIADSIMNYTNSNFLKDDTASWFTVSTFFYSAVLGISMLIVNMITSKTKWSPRSFVAGVILGIPNYFSIYFLLRSLSAFNNDGAFMFPITNIGVILFSITISVIFFKEHLSNANKLGIGLSILAILLISYQELFYV